MIRRKRMPFAGYPVRIKDRKERQYWWLGWRWALVNLAATALLAFNFWFYGQYPADWAKWLQGLVLGVGILWLLVQMYTFPLLLEQADRRMRVAMRNSVVLYLKRPGVGLGLALLEAVILGLSYLLRVPWVLITASLCVYLATRVVVSLVDELQPAGSPARPVD